MTPSLVYFIAPYEPPNRRWGFLNDLARILADNPEALAFTLRRSNFRLVTDILLDNTGPYVAPAADVWLSMGRAAGLNRAALLEEEMMIAATDGCSWHRCPLHNCPTTAVRFRCMCKRVVYCGPFCQSR